MQNKTLVVSPPTVTGAHALPAVLRGDEVRPCCGVVTHLPCLITTAFLQPRGGQPAPTQPSCVSLKTFKPSVSSTVERTPVRRWVDTGRTDPSWALRTRRTSMLTEFGCCCKLAMCSSCRGMFSSKPRLRWRPRQWSDTNSSAESPASCNVKPWSRSCWAAAQTWTFTPAQMLNFPSDTLTFKWYRSGSRFFSTTIFPSTASTENRPWSRPSETSL